VRVLFWTRNHFAQQQISAALSGPPVDLVVAATLDEVMDALPRAEMFIASDCDPEQAAVLVPAIEASPVRWFQFLSAGRERLMAAGLPDRLELFGIGDALAPAISEHGMALALALYRGLPGTLAAGATGDWSAARTVVRRQMEGDTALILGLGAIGRDLARRAREWGMNALAVTRTPKPDPNCDEVRPLAELDGMLSRAGVVFLSLALTPQTRHLLGAEQFGRMRSGAFLVNLARGGLVDQAALAEAIRSGRLGGAGLDVTDPEPLPPGDPLWSLPNVVITPHVAVTGSTLSAERLAVQVARNVMAVAGRSGGRLD
jgi:phosphoglycerate dehydrogenase-like enzyme